MTNVKLITEFYNRNKDKKQHRNRREEEERQQQHHRLTGHQCCDVAVAQINYPSFKHNTQDSIKQARGRSHEEVQVRFLC